MSVQTFRYKPKSTWGVTVEVATDCCCFEKPAVSGRLYGFKQFGLILCYEDKISTHLHKWKISKCENSNCEHAICYELEIKFLVSCEVGLGVGIGNFGTGAFGFPTRSVEETVKFQTECICCDSEIESKRTIQSMLQINSPPIEKRSSIPLVLTLSTIGAVAIALKNLDASSNFVVYFMLAILIGVLVSAYAIYRRLRRLAKGAKENDANKKEHNTPA